MSGETGGVKLLGPILFPSTIAILDEDIESFIIGVEEIIENVLMKEWGVKGHFTLNDVIIMKDNIKQCNIRDLSMNLSEGD